MDKIYFYFFMVFIFFYTISVNGQEKVVVQGAITLGNDETGTPAEGTIRWTGNDFEGWTGSKWISLTKGPCGGLYFVLDVDANRYRIVSIDNQCWMADNLRVVNFNDGTPIQKLEADTSWTTVTDPAYCWPEDMGSNANPFGALYNWHTVDPASNGNKNVCPIGWHVPSQQEQLDLVNFLGGESVAGNPLKETGNVHFLDSNENATNLTGFTAMPGGYRSQTSYYELGYYAQYWSATASNATNAYFMDIEYDGDYANIETQLKNRGNSIRCIKD